MHARLTCFLLMASATLWSYLSVFAGQMIIPAFRVGYQLRTEAELRDYVPTITLLACDYRWAIPGLLALTCIGASAALWWRPDRAMPCLALGLCAQWLVVWVAAFCFCYAGFLGFWSMHHRAWFEFDRLMTLDGGIFPVTLALIVTPLVLALRSVLRREAAPAIRPDAAPIQPRV